MDGYAIGAFFSGVAAVIGSIWALRIARRRADEECQRRIEEIHASLMEGVELGKDK